MISDQPELAACVGFDWADDHHAVALQAIGSDQVRTFDLKQQPEELQEWANRLRVEFGGRKVAIAIERSRGAVIYALMHYEFLVFYPINPMSLATYRKSFRVSGAKDDPADADLLLDLIVRHRERLRPWNPDTTETRRIQLLSESRRKLVNQQTAITNRLEALLKDYFPQALEWAGCLNTPQACDFLTKWPSLQALQKAKASQLRTFYLGHGCRRAEVIESRIEQSREARPLTVDEAVISASILMVQATVNTLRSIIASIELFDRELKEAFQRHPDHSLFESFPGAGPVLAPRLLVAMGTDRSRFTTAAEVQQFSGIAPVTKKSGKSCFVHRRHACPRFLLQTFHEWAGQTIPRSTWARAYYDYQKAQGKWHHAAVRALAFKWIRIVYRCWRDSIPYDEQIYLASLRRKKPAWAVQAGLTDAAAA
jgi:transposase